MEAPREEIAKGKSKFLKDLAKVLCRSEGTAGNEFPNRCFNAEENNALQVASQNGQLYLERRAPFVFEFIII